MRQFLELLYNKICIFVIFQSIYIMHNGYQIIDICNIEDNPQLKFIRIQPTDIKMTLREVFNSLSNLCWIDSFDQSYMRNSYKQRAERTTSHLELGRRDVAPLFAPPKRKPLHRICFAANLMKRFEIWIRQCPIQKLFHLSIFLDFLL